MKKDCDLFKFKDDHPNCHVTLWAIQVGKHNSREHEGYQIDYDHLIYFFGVDGHFIKTNAK